MESIREVTIFQFISDSLSLCLSHLAMFGSLMDNISSSNRPLKLTLQRSCLPKQRTSCKLDYLKYLDVFGTLSTFFSSESQRNQSAFPKRDRGRSGGLHPRSWYPSSDFLNIQNLVTEHIPLEVIKCLDLSSGISEVAILYKSSFGLFSQ